MKNQSNIIRIIAALLAALLLFLVSCTNQNMPSPPDAIGTDPAGTDSADILPPDDTLPPETEFPETDVPETDVPETDVPETDIPLPVITDPVIGIEPVSYPSFAESPALAYLSEGQADAFAAMSAFLSSVLENGTQTDPYFTAAPMRRGDYDTAYRAMDADYHDLVYLVLSKYAPIEDTDGCLIGWTLCVSSDEADAALSRFRRICESADDILRTIEHYGDDCSKAFAIAKWVISNISYDYYYNADSFYAVGALENGLAVCVGYTSVYAMLCRKAGLQMICVAATASAQMEHAWNMLFSDGAWYHIDTTWMWSGEDHFANCFMIPDAVCSLFGHPQWEYLLLEGDCDGTAPKMSVCPKADSYAYYSLYYTSAAEAAQSLGGERTQGEYVRYQIVFSADMTEEIQAFAQYSGQTVTTEQGSLYHIRVRTNEQNDALFCYIADLFVEKTEPDAEGALSTPVTYTPKEFWHNMSGSGVYSNDAGVAFTFAAPSHFYTAIDASAATHYRYDAPNRALYEAMKFTAESSLSPDYSLDESLIRRRAVAALGQSIVRSEGVTETGNRYLIFSTQGRVPRAYVTVWVGEYLLCFTYDDGYRLETLPAVLESFALASN